MRVAGVLRRNYRYDVDAVPPKWERAELAGGLPLALAPALSSVAEARFELAMSAL